MTTMKIQSMDGDVIEVDANIAKCSATLQTRLNEMKEGADEIISLSNVRTLVLDKVIEWATQHKDDLPATEDEQEEIRTDDISALDAKFLEVGHEMLFELILAASFLGIQGLLRLTSKAMANKIKGKTADEIRKTFSVTNDFTAEQEAQLRRENEWCQESE